MPILALLSLLGFALALRTRTRHGFFLCLFAVVPGTAGVLYLAGMAGALHITAHALFAAGLAAGTCSVGLAVARGTVGDLLRRVLMPVPVIFAVSVTAYWLATKSVQFHFWDEFSHWGLAARETWSTGRLRTQGTATVFQDYPPGTDLFYYFFAANGAYSEQLLYWAHFTLVAAPLMVIFSGWTWRQAHWAAVAVVTLLLLLAARLTLFSLYVDSVLSVYFATALYAYLRTDSDRKLLFLVPPLFFLPLVKASGILFALVCVAAILMDRGAGYLRCRPGTLRLGYALAGHAWMLAKRGRLGAPLLWYAPILTAIAAYFGCVMAVQALALLCAATALRYRQRTAGLLSGMSRALPIAPTLILASLIAGPIASWGSWAHWTNAHWLQGPFAVKYSIRDATSALCTSTWRDVAQLRTSFFSRFRSSPVLVTGPTVYDKVLDATTGNHGRRIRGLSAAEWTGIVVLLLAIVTLLARSAARMRLAVVLAVAVAGFAVYVPGLFTLYVYSFPSYERQGLPQFERYVWTYLSALAVLGWALLARPSAQGGRASARAWTLFASCTALTAALYLFENCDSAVAAWCRPQPLAERAKVQREAALVCTATAQNSRILVIVTETPGLKELMFAYEVSPRHVDILRYAPSAPARGHVADTGESMAKALSLLFRQGACTHVYIDNADGPFWKVHATALLGPGHGPGDHLFEARWDPEGHMSLVPTMDR